MAGAGTRVDGGYLLAALCELASRRALRDGVITHAVVDGVIAW